MTLQAIVLACASFLHMEELHPYTLHQAARVQISIGAFAREVALVDSDQIPLAECIIATVRREIATQ